MEFYAVKRWISIIYFPCTKYMEVGYHRGTVANKHITAGSNSYEKVKNFKYLGSWLTNKNSIHEEIHFII